MRRATILRGAKNTRPLRQKQFSGEAAEKPVKNPAETGEKSRKRASAVRICTEKCAIRQASTHQSFRSDAQRIVQRAISGISGEADFSTRASGSGTET
jgi:hypothetical protein